MKIFQYDTNHFPFHQLVSKILEVAELDKLHETINTLPTLVEHKTDQNTSIHRLYYSRQSLLLPLFHKFVSSIIRPMFDESILYQAKPTFRCQLPRNLSVGAFHKDKDYSHDASEINFFVPLTTCFDTNTIWVESEEDKGDYQPVNMKLGDCLIFNGANLKHGNKPNVTGLTRISFDFRVLRQSSYNPNNGKKTTNVGVPMVIGEYFAVCN